MFSILFHTLASVWNDRFISMNYYDDCNKRLVEMIHKPARPLRSSTTTNAKVDINVPKKSKTFKQSDGSSFRSITPNSNVLTSNSSGLSLTDNYSESYSEDDNDYCNPFKYMMTSCATYQEYYHKDQNASFYDHQRNLHNVQTPRAVNSNNHDNLSEISFESKLNSKHIQLQRLQQKQLQQQKQAQWKEKMIKQILSETEAEDENDECDGVAATVAMNTSDTQLNDTQSSYRYSQHLNTQGGEDDYMHKAGMELLAATLAADNQQLHHPAQSVHFRTGYSTPAQQTGSTPAISRSLSRSHSPEHTGISNRTDVKTIFAPNVEKLSPASCVEIQIKSGDIVSNQSAAHSGGISASIGRIPNAVSIKASTNSSSLTSCSSSSPSASLSPDTSSHVSILCSVDVLKIRSDFFHSILIQQEQAADSRSAQNQQTTTGVSHTPGAGGGGGGSHNVSPYSDFFNTATLTEWSSGGTKKGGNAMLTNFLPVSSSSSRTKKSDGSVLSDRKLWRPIILLTDTHPDSALSLLEALHVTGYSFAWQKEWVRLSVLWSIRDVAIEYARQIDVHVDALKKSFESYHWRLNSQVLSGCTAAVLKSERGHSGMSSTVAAAVEPKVVMGVVVALPTQAMLHDVESTSNRYSKVYLRLRREPSLQRPQPIDGAGIVKLLSPKADKGFYSPRQPVEEGAGTDSQNQDEGYINSRDDMYEDMNSYFLSPDRPLKLQSSHRKPPLYVDTNNTFQTPKKMVSDINSDLHAPSGFFSPIRQESHYSNRDRQNAISFQNKFNTDKNSAATKELSSLKSQQTIECGLLFWIKVCNDSAAIVEQNSKLKSISLSTHVNKLHSFGIRNDYHEEGSATEGEGEVDSVWMSPDDHFVAVVAKTCIADQDIVMFWEMVLIMLAHDVSELVTVHIKASLKRKHELIQFLKRPEYKILLQHLVRNKGGLSLDCLPKDILVEILQNYVE